VERVTRAERMILATILFPEICAIDEGNLAIFERARDAVHESAHELADVMIVAEKVQAAYDGMHELEHEAMKAKLLKLAKAGRPRPAPDTLEGHCLAAYTDDGRIPVPGIMLEGFAPATARQEVQ
jgi:hypothetical protein